MTPVDLADVLEQAIGIAKQREADMPAPMVSGLETVSKLTTDAGHLADALAELLLNAHQAQPPDAVRVTASVDGTTGRCLIQVADHGVGMAPSVLRHAFDPFYSAKPAGRRAGLGLARAQRLIETLGGRIELTSTEGKGTTAVIMLPITTKDANE